MHNWGLTLPHEVLLERVWVEEFAGHGPTLYAHIRWLRDKIEPDASQPIYIHTIRGTGYRFDTPPSSR